MLRIRTTRAWALALLVPILTACAALPQPDVIPPEAAAPAEDMTPVGSGPLYRIETAQLTIFTYRAGWLSGLAHNHVMETDAVHGAIRLAEPVEQSTARLYFRPWDLVLDAPEARAAAGAGFESTRTEADIAATRTRMLGPRGFDNNRYPFVVVDVGWGDGTSVALHIHFRDRVVERPVPVTWSEADGQLEAQADFEIDHADLGIRPYSAFAGAMAVAQPIRVRIALSASRASSL